LTLRRRAHDWLQVLSSYSAAEFCDHNNTSVLLGHRHRSISLPFFSKTRVSMLEVQNRALIKSAGERKQRISELDQMVERLKAEVERLKAEREFYYKRVLTLEQHNREITESATKYSLWGQKLERELARIDPNGAPRRRFGAQCEE
jgi:uncharacterized small protein (DUF1192 family)